jgi:hypothetical protein
MRHLAVPMIGGLLTSFFLELTLLPGLYYMVMGAVLRRHLKDRPASQPPENAGGLQP